MKDTIKTSRTAGYLEKIFRAVNADWFGGELEEPIITIQSTPRAYGHVTVSKVWKRKGEQRHELNIGAETLQRPIEEVVATIVHEAVHLYNLAHGVQDCSRGNTYHNKRFKEEAERRGLVISHHPTYGWTITEPSEALIDYIIAQGWSEIQMNRGGGWTPPPSAGGKTGNGGTQTGGSTEPPKRSSITRLISYSARPTNIPVSATAPSGGGRNIARNTFFIEAGAQIRKRCIRDFTKNRRTRIVRINTPLTYAVVVPNLSVVDKVDDIFTRILGDINLTGGATK